MNRAFRLWSTDSYFSQARKRCVTYDPSFMKLAGFLLLIAGWCIALLSVSLLPAAGARSAFVLTALAIELLGLALAIRSHLVLEAERE
jgi:hypothetical protein